jgi:hypothetical protein
MERFRVVTAIKKTSHYTNSVLQKNNMYISVEQGVNREQKCISP